MAWLVWFTARQQDIWRKNILSAHNVVFFFFKIEQAVQVNYRFSEGEIIM